LDHIMPATIAEKAELEITREPLQARCLTCGIGIDFRNDYSLRCPNCGDNNLEVTRGKSIYVQAIEGE